MKTIHISTELEQKIVAFCDDELNYHINESGHAGEYTGEIEAQIELLRLLGHEDMAKNYEKQFREEIGEQEEKGFGIYSAICAPEFYTGRKIDVGEDEYYLIKAVDAVKAEQLFKEEMHKMYESFEYDFRGDNICEQYESAVQNGNIHDYLAKTNDVLRITESELESIESENPFDYEEYDDEDEDREDIRKDDTELLLDFIEEHLEDFVGFDPYADPGGYDLRRARDEKETYVFSLSDDTSATLADEIRERPEDFYCEEGEIVDRRALEAEKE